MKVLIDVELSEAQLGRSLLALGSEPAFGVGQDFFAVQQHAVLSIVLLIELCDIVNDMRFVRP